MRGQRNLIRYKVPDRCGWAQTMSRTVRFSSHPPTPNRPTPSRPGPTSTFAGKRWKAGTNHAHAAYPFDATVAHNGSTTGPREPQRNSAARPRAPRNARSICPVHRLAHGGNRQPPERGTTLAGNRSRGTSRPVIIATQRIDVADDARSPVQRPRPPLLSTG